MTAVLAELETLKAELKKARRKVKQYEATAAEAEKAQAAEKVAGDKDRARVLKVEETLKGVFEACNKLQAEGQRTKESFKSSSLPIPTSRPRPGRTARCSSGWRKHLG